MRKTKYILILLAFLTAFSGCDDFLGDNRDPDGTDQVPVDQIMPVVLFYTALENYDHSEYGAYLSQCLTTAGKSQTGSHAYRSGWEFLGMNRHPQWRRHFYDVGSNAKELLRFAEEENSMNYVALVRLLRLLSVQQTTDAFGDMPLTEAYMSASPKYDTQESIYEWLETETEALIQLFDGPEVTQATNRPMGQNVDRVFAGDMGKWKQVLLAVKARILLRDLPNLNTGSAGAILTAAEQALSNWVDPRYKFDGGSSVEKNCMWGRNNKPVNSWESRSNDLLSAIPSKYFIENMMGFDPATGEFTDPRLPLLMEARADDSDEITYRYLENNSGMPPTHKIEWYPDLYESVLTTDTSTITFITREELHFIAAEAAYWAQDKNRASEHLRQGIESHMKRILVPQQEIDTYLNDPELVPGSSNIDLSHIMVEKYKAMYLQVEQWNDLRRYGYSNDVNDRKYDNTIVYPGLRRPHNLYEAYWSNENQWIQRINYDPETEEKYNREELIRLDAFRNPEWLKKPMIWAPQN
ncbi:Starch-binding associating with outer membrane [Mariniphaga anaerophila]|uniref:Starch-binding associating with outer membrane n=1 Tax=Mariniphaga anaerophila TaxID=1484053 RepID=A0A1M4SNK7_9BACT|nr:SusD/RagB family nutrient-binding outer membrane lipoprotein [Mariniphaga anaerophila]SHE33781.1 Starch-binding associating with outer membrane [Mariniphaga anaerophila]